MQFIRVFELEEVEEDKLIRKEKEIIERKSKVRIFNKIKKKDLEVNRIKILFFVELNLFGML